MTVSLKDSMKFFGIIAAMCCAAIVCNMFLNYDIDLRAIEGQVPEEMKTLYEALKLNDIAVCAISGISLVLTSVVMLVFYIGQYISAHSQRFGILKALGYSDFKIAVKCVVFGFCVLIGVVLGLALSWAIMPTFYKLQNANSEGIPEVVMHFHPVLFTLILVLPVVFFSALSIGVALYKLRLPALSLIRGEGKERKLKKIKEDKKDRSFIAQLGLNVLNDKKLLAFFVAFGGFCFSAMMQMGLSMREYASDMMGYMMLIMGLVLAFVALYLAMSTVIGGNKKKIAMLKVTGYSLKECAVAVLGLYHIPAFIGFAIGSAYQYGILVVMVNIVFATFDGVPRYSFNWEMFGICLAVFIVVYELFNLAYSIIISKTSIKAVMSE
ncbi:MAG: FtsX-like permease family protein [Candidatus Coproplasma sp.]